MVACRALLWPIHAMHSHVSRPVFRESSRGNAIGATGPRASERESVSERVSEREIFQRFLEVLRGFERFSEVFSDF